MKPMETKHFLKWCLRSVYVQYTSETDSTVSFSNEVNIFMHYDKRIEMYRI